MAFLFRLEHDAVRVRRQLADDDITYVDVRTQNAVRDVPILPVLRRVLVEYRLASPWTADADPVFAAGRRKPKAYRNVRRAFAVAVKEAKINVADDERLSPHSLRRATPRFSPGPRSEGSGPPDASVPRSRPTGA